MLNIWQNPFSDNSRMFVIVLSSIQLFYHNEIMVDQNRLTKVGLFRSYWCLREARPRPFSYLIFRPFLTNLSNSDSFWPVGGYHIIPFSMHGTNTSMYCWWQKEKKTYKEKYPKSLTSPVTPPPLKNWISEKRKKPKPTWNLYRNFFPCVPYTNPDQKVEEKMTWTLNDNYCTMNTRNTYTMKIT